MNDITGINSQSIIDQINQGSSSATSTTEADNGESDFLKLLVAQLNNQNPLEPQENGEFLSQLAQFSTVEGIEKLNLTFDQFSSSMLSNQALQATALVGRRVQVPSSVGQLNSGSALTGTVELPASTGNLAVEIYSDTGAFVRQIPMGTHGAGPVNFSWDGFDSEGNAMPPGLYTVAATAYIGDELEQIATGINVNVDSVTTNQSGGVVLNLEGSLGSISLDDVLQIN